MSNDKQYWFPAKRYGWGWGLPITWQGWALTIAFATLAVAGVFMFPPSLSMPAYLIYCGLLTAVYFAAIWVKGEPPKWRWGGK